MSNTDDNPRDSYFIKEGYFPNLSQNTLDPNDDIEYWNKDRIETGSRFQYDVYKMAVKALDTRNGAQLMDVGSGPPTKLARLLGERDIPVHLVDQPNVSSFAKSILPHCSFSPANLEEIDIDIGQAFEFVMCADVIEHLINPDPCLKFIQKHLSKDGLLFISTPERDVLRGTSCMESPHPMHVREWNMAEFRAFLESRGFEVLQHVLLPQERVSTSKKLVGQFLNAMGYPPKWYSCQLAVCKT